MAIGYLAKLRNRLGKITFLGGGPHGGACGGATGRIGEKSTSRFFAS